MKLRISCLVLGLILFSTLGSKTYALELSISGNGNSSQNEVNLDISTTTNITQVNDVQINNQVTTEATTGENTASGNVAEAIIATGNITTETSISSTVNISALETTCCKPDDTNLTIAGNGSYSTNNLDAQINNQTTVSSEQTARIQNSISTNAQTGQNSTEDNPGNVSIKTGDIKIDSQIESQHINESLVNILLPNHPLSIKILNNGTNSKNSVGVDLKNLTVININNLSDIQNNTISNASTGGNLANGNLGDISVITGDIWIGTGIKNGPINLSLVKTPCCFPGSIDDPGDSGNQDDEDDSNDTGGTTSSPPDSSRIF